jgi:lysophospholipase
VESRWRADDGHELRRIDWPGPVCKGGARGSILFMPGRGDAYEKYLETFEHWRQKGWCVTAADWRGQAGSGRLGSDSVTGHVDDFSIWIADLANFWSDWTKDREGPLVLAGHSMGGHLVLRAVAEKALHPAPDGVILSAPMLGVHPEYIPMTVQRLLATVMAAIGNPRRPAWKWSEKPGELPRNRQRLLTHDDDRYQDEVWWREHRPELAMGPGSWGWVKSSLASFRRMEEPGLLEAVNIPVCIVATSDDRLVSPRAIRKAVERLPQVHFLEFGPEAAHEVLREEDSVRDKALAAIDAFLDRLAPL